jgi:hypothetical protein
MRLPSITAITITFLLGLPFAARPGSWPSRRACLTPT